MVKTLEKVAKRISRHKRIRKTVNGTGEQPRLCVRRSTNHFYAQVINDESGKVLLSMSTLTKTVKDKIKSGGNLGASTALGEVFATEAVNKGIKKVCFDRGGNIYHGRIKAFAEAARKGGMEF